MSMHLSALSNTWSHQRRKRRLMLRLEAQSKKNKINTEDAKMTDLDQSESSEMSKIETHNNNEDNTETSRDREPILEAFLKVFKKDNIILLEIEYLSGDAGKEGLHQIVQYIKNNWK